MNSAKSGYLRLGNVIVQVLLLTFVLLILSLKAEGGTWTAAGGPDGALVKQLAISPNYMADKTIVAISGPTGYGILFKSTDGGSSWFPVNTGNKGLDTVAFSPNYAVDQTIFAGGPVGVLKTTDGGTTWNSIKTNGYTTTITISPNYSIDQTIFLATGFEILRSTDGGMSWLKITPAGVCADCGIGYSSIATSPNYAIDRTVFATISAPSYMTGLYKSTDGGNNWSIVNTASYTVNTVFLSPSFATDQTLFAFSSSVIIKSIDGGTSWSVVSTRLPNGLVKSIAFSPNQTLFVGMNAMHSDWNTSQGLGIFKSTDGGASWTAVNTGLTNLEVNSIALSPNYNTDQTLFAGTYDSEGIFKSINGAASWNLTHVGLNGQVINSVAISPNYSTDHALFAFARPQEGVYYGTRSSPGSLFKSIDEGITWTSVATGMTPHEWISQYDFASVALSPSYTTDQTLIANWYGKSTDSGNSWTGSNSERIAFAFSPNYILDKTIFSFNRFISWCFFCPSDNGYLVKSTDGGTSWTPIYGGGIPVSLAISPNYAIDQTVFAGFSSGVSKTITGGTTWYQVNSGLPQSPVNSLVLSPNYSIDQTVFAGTNSGMFKSINGGTSWNAINIGLTSTNTFIPTIISLAISPNFAIDQTIFAGTRGYGVYKSNDGGLSWTVVNGGLTYMDIRSLAISPGYPCDGTIFAGTGGSSVWKYTDTEAMTTCGPAIVDTDTDGYTSDVDCDDTNPSIHPNAPELCNNIDDNCDNNTDEGFPNLNTLCSVGTGPCTGSGSYVCSIDGTGTVCSATSGLPSPEVCDGIDNDCDGVVDEGCNEDSDGDGLTNAEEAIKGTDPTKEDTDGDGLSDGREVNETKTNPLKVDTDGDALPDGWEVDGIDGLNLKEMGADPLYKDIFVEVDYMVKPVECSSGSGTDKCTPGHTHKPYDDSIKSAIEAFLKHDIRLHVDYGPKTIINHPDDTTDIKTKWGELSGSNPVPETVDNKILGNPNMPTSCNDYQLFENELWHAFDLMKNNKNDNNNANFNPTRRRVFHYVLFAHDIGVFSCKDGKVITDQQGNISRPSGISNGIPGSDFIVSLGSFFTIPFSLVGENKPEGNVSQQTGTFMHELGHNLSLWHGGNENVNYKPNYLSLMNYSFQMSGLLKNGKPGLFDYSEFGTNPEESAIYFNPLKEEFLDEKAGLQVNGSDTLDYSTLYFCPSVSEQLIANAQRSGPVSGAINWNCNKNNLGGDIIDDTTIRVNINADFEAAPQGIGPPSPIFSMLHSFNDWENLVFRGGKERRIGQLGALEQEYVQPTIIIVNELTPEEDILIPKLFAVVVTNPGNQILLQGESVISPFKVINLGEQADSYIVTAISSRGWSIINGIPDVIHLGPREETVIEVHTFAPLDTLNGDVDEITLKAVSINSPGLLDTTAVIITAFDGIAPVINTSISPSVNVAGWHNSDVTVTFICSDVGSGIQTCSNPVTVTMEGENQITSSATDRVGNNTLNSMIINLDKTPPNITASLSSIPNAFGWYNSDIIVIFTCSDALSGITTCPNPVTISMEGRDQVITGTASDIAGNSTITSVIVSLDKTPSSLTMPEMDPIYAYRQQMTLNFDAQDALSTIDTTYATLNGVLINSGERITLNLVGQNVFTLTTSDRAGNVTAQNLTFEVINTPPTAEAGADLSLKCLEMSCPVILDGSSSTDPNSALGTQDDIVSYEWYENYGEAGQVHLASVKSISLDLPLGDHIITLIVTDTMGAIGKDTLKVSVNPAQLSLLEISKAEVEWDKDGTKPNRVKIHGRVAMPAGKDYYIVNPIGTVSVDISSIANVINQSMTFQVKGENGSKWECKAPLADNGITHYMINWNGAKFDYNKEIRIKSNHLGQDVTTLEIDRKDIIEPIIITVQDNIIRIDSAGAVTVTPSAPSVDVDDDGEIEVILPFALTQNTVFTVTHGATSYQVKVGDYYSAAVGKFELMGQFKTSNLNGSSQPAALEFGITFGDQRFPGMVQIMETDWNQLKNGEWKYKR